jgi:hypothetical protein
LVASATTRPIFTTEIVTSPMRKRRDPGSAIADEGDIERQQRRQQAGDRRAGRDKVA